jgi:hypothetical protein
MKPKDYLDQELSVGDIVLFITNNYRDFSTGKIIKLGKAKATIADIAVDRDWKTLKYYCNIVKINENN